MPPSPESPYDPLADRRAPDGAGVRRLPVRARSSSTSSSPGWRACRPTAPRSGPTGWAPAPGGIANLAIASSRLGLRTSLAAAFGDDDYGDFCWRPWPSRSTSTSALPALRALALAGDRLDGRRPGPQHGHPRAHAPGDGHRDDRHAAALPGRASSTSTWPSRWAAATARPGPSWPAPRAPSSSPTWAGTPPAPGRRPRARPAVGLPRVPAQRRRGDGLHPHRHPARRPLRPRRPGAARRGHQRRAGRAGDRRHDRRGGDVPALRVAGARPDRRRRRVRRRHACSARWPAGRWPTGSRSPTLCSALAVQQFGGSLAAPGWGDIADWWHTVRDNGERGSYHAR